MNERLKEKQLSTAEEKRKRGDLITIHKLIELAGGGGIMRSCCCQGKERKRERRGHYRKLRKGTCQSTVKFSFPQTSVGIWNGLREEVGEAGYVCQMKGKLEMYR